MRRLGPGLDHDRARNVVFQGNIFHGVGTICQNPLTVSHTQNTAAGTWTVDAADLLPFGGKPLSAVSVLPKGALRNAGSSVVYPGCYATPATGSGDKMVELKWAESVRGVALVTLRSDVPQ